MTRPLLSILQARKQLGIGDSKMRGLISRREILAVKIGHDWRIDPNDLDAYVEGKKRDAGVPVSTAARGAFDADDQFDSPAVFS